LRLTSADLTMGGEAALSYVELGGLAALESVPSDVASENPDVKSLAALFRTARGRAAISALDAFCTCGSLRQAAEQLHLHHSSVASRLQYAEVSLGISLDNPRHRLRMGVALVLWRLGRQRRDPR
jgi:sugar diacid utilization regulator